MGPVVLTVLIISSVVFCYKKFCKKVVDEIEDIIADENDDDYCNMSKVTSDENAMFDPDSISCKDGAQPPTGKQQQAWEQSVGDDEAYPQTRRYKLRNAMIARGMIAKQQNA